MQIRTKLTLQFFFISTGLFTLALFFIYVQFSKLSTNEFYGLLESKALMTADMVLSHENELKPIPASYAGDAESSLPSNENVEIYNKAYERVFALNQAGVPIAPKYLQEIERKGSFRFDVNTLDAFGATVQSRSGNNYVVVSQGEFDDSSLTKLRNILFFTFALISIAVIAGGWFYAGQALRPVSQIVNEVDEILPTDLSRRLDAKSQKGELLHLVSTFNRMLDRIQQAFDMQRGFISNVSHELKNPLAAMDAQLQVARQKDRSTGEYQQVLASLHDDVREISDTADKLLQLARMHSDPGGIHFTRIRLDEVLLLSRDQLLKSHPSYTIIFEIQQMPQEEHWLSVKGNEALLRSAFSNLFDNGCKFSPDHRVHVLIRFSDNGDHEVKIQDKGPGISASDQKRIFEPFFRAAAHAHIKGSGVGLSLVRSVIELHGISMKIETETSENKGSVFTLKFPKQINSNGR